MLFTTYTSRRPHLLTALLLGAAVTLLVMAAPANAAPMEHARSLAACAAPISDADLQSLQMAAENRLFVVRQLAGILPSAIVNFEPNALADLVIADDYQLLADLAAVNDNVSPAEYAASLNAAMGDALTAEAHLFTDAIALGSGDELTLHSAMLELQVAQGDLQLALSQQAQQLNTGPMPCSTPFDACALVAPADAAAVLGAPDPRGLPPTEGLPMPPPGLVEGSGCTYRTNLHPAQGGAPPGVLGVLIGRFTDPGAAHLGMQQLLQLIGAATSPITASAIPGLGDEAIGAAGAFPAELGGGQGAALAVRKGSVVFLLSAGVSGEAAPADLAARVQKLGEKVLARLN